MNNPSIEHQKMVIEINKAIDDLPSLPSAVSKLMALSISDSHYFDIVQEVAEQDPTFAVRLLKVANSAANASISEITSISHAVARIGTRHIKELILAFAVAKIFIPRNDSERNLWVHSIQVAVASQTIARISSHLGIKPEEAYLCGLLHDIGRFVLFNKFPEGPIRIDEKDWESPEKLLEVEKEVCGINHATLGAYAAKKWGLPHEVTNVISNHHSYDYLTLTPAEIKESKLVQIVQMSDFLSVLLMKNPDILVSSPEEIRVNGKE